MLGESMRNDERVYRKLLRIQTVVLPGQILNAGKSVPPSWRRRPWRFLRSLTKKRQRKRKAELDPEEEEEESDGEIEEDMIEESEDDDIDLLEVPEWDVDSFDGSSEYFVFGNSLISDAPEGSLMLSGGSSQEG
ncbi:hypothetical protein F2Q70_00039962 [Brassica cretica]|uniref:Uncharacterized protein n=1 Tax=Brassica cretica TaxID=69181 RepID=A0A8S9KAS6_BRACR|nr:hypothetical protein F2Q70_00039962 [Brassica cretica]